MLKRPVVDRRRSICRRVRDRAEPRQPSRAPRTPPLDLYPTTGRSAAPHPRRDGPTTPRVTGWHRHARYGLRPPVRRRRRLQSASDAFPRSRRRRPGTVRYFPRLLSSSWPSGGPHPHPHRESCRSLPLCVVSRRWIHPGTLCRRSARNRQRPNPPSVALVTRSFHDAGVLAPSS